MTRPTPFLLAAGLGLALLGCWSGGVDGPQNPPLAAGTYQLAFSVGVVPASAQMSGADLTVALPPGVTVATAADGSAQILATSLAAGAGVQGTSLIVGSYDPAGRQAHLSLSVAPSAAWSGEFARLTVTVPPGSQVSERTLLQAAGPGTAACTLVGLATAGRDPVVLTGAAATSVRLVRR